MLDTGRWMLEVMPPGAMSQKFFSQNLSCLGGNNRITNKEGRRKTKGLTLKIVASQKVRVHHVIPAKAGMTIGLKKSSFPEVIEKLLKIVSLILPSELFM